MASPELDNLKIQQEINAAIAARGKLLTSQTSLIADQTELAIKFCKAMKCEGIDEISDRITEIRAGLESAGKAATSATDGINSVTKGLGSAAGGAEDLATSIDKVQGSLKDAEDEIERISKSINKTFSKGVSVVGGFAKGLGSVVEGVWNIGSAILDIPLAIFDMMLGQAAELASGSHAIATALEKVRGQYGDISKGFSKQVAEGSKDIGKSLGQAGLSISKVFGHGPEGTAAAIQASLDMATALGPAANILGREFKDAAGDLVTFQKGLGVTNEDMKAFIYASKAVGTDVVKDLEMVAKISEDMASKFGMSSKDIARDMAYLTTQSGKFGRLTKTAMAAASVTVRTYGLELKDVAGILDQFSDFESAATNASKMSQAFGAAIDPMKLMKEENPAKAFEYLRKQMLAAGNDASTFNKAQIKLLATQTGMDENLVRTAFSAKNVGKSYEQIQKESEKSGKKQKSQQEIMETLGKSIEKVVEALQHSGGFWAEFVAGFGEGARRAGPMAQVLRDLAGALKAIRQLGRAVGDAFINAFPGVKDMLGAMHEFFGGGNFTKIVDKFRIAFSKFFEDLNKNPKQAFDNLKKNLFDAFDGQSATGKKFIAGAEKFMSTLSNVMAGAVITIGKTLTEGAKQLVEFLKNPQAALDAASGFGSSFMGPIMASLAEVLPGLFAELWELTKILLVKGVEMLAPYFGYYIGIMIGKAMIIGAAQAAGGALVKAAAAKIAGVAATIAAAPPVKKIPGGGAAAVAEAGSITKILAKLGINTIMKALGAGLALAVFVGVAIVAFAKAVSEAAKFLKDTDWMDIAKVFAATGIGVVAAIGLSIATKGLSPSSLTKSTFAMLAAAAYVAVAVFAFGVAVALAATSLENVSWESMAKVFVATAFGVLGVMNLASTSALITPGTITKGGLGLAQGAAFVAGAVTIFAAALTVAALMLSTVSWEDIGKVFVAVALGVGGVIVLAEAAKLINIASLAAAMPGLGGAALFVSIAIVAFAYAVSVAAEFLKDTDWMDIGKVFAATAFGILAVIALAYAGSTLGTPAVAAAMVMALLGMLAAALFVRYPIVAFAKAVSVAAEVLKDTDWMDIGKVFAATAFGIVAVIALVVEGAALGSPIGLFGLAIATLGVIAAAAFLSYGMIKFVEAIKSVVPLLAGTSWESIVTLFAAVTLGIASVAVLVAAGLLFGNPIGLLALISAGAGLLAISAFMSLALPSFVSAIAESVAAINGADLGSAGAIFEKLATVVSSLGVIVAGGILIAYGAALLSPIILILPFALAAVWALTGFLVETISSFKEVITEIQGLPVVNTSELKEKVGVIVSLVGAVSTFASMGIRAGELEQASKYLGNPNTAGAMSSMDEFMKSAIDNVMSIVAQISGIALSWSDGDLKKMVAMSSVISSIVSLIGSLTNPLQALSSMDIGWYESTSGKLFAVTNNLVKIIKAVVETLPPLLTSIGEVVKSILQATGSLTPAQILGVEAGTKLLGAFGGIIGSMASSLTSIKLEGTEAEIALKVKGYEKIIPIIKTSVIGLIKDMKDIMPDIIKGISGITIEDPEKLTKKLDVLLKVMSFLTAFSTIGLNMQESLNKVAEPAKEGAAKVDPKTFTQSFDELAGALTGALAKEGSIQKLSTAIEGFKMGDPKTMDRIVKYLQSTLSIITEYNNIANSGGVVAFDTAKAVANLKDGITALNDLAIFINGGGYKTMDVNTVKRVKGSLTNTLALKSEYDTITSAFSGTQATAGAKITAMVTDLKKVASLSDITKMAFISEINALSIVTSLGAISSVVTAYTDIGKLFTGVYENQVSNGIIQMVADINEIDAQLNELSMGNLDLSIDSLASRLNIANDDIRIEHKPINIHMSMNITFDAEKFTTDILKTTAHLVKTGKAPPLDWKNDSGKKNSFNLSEYE